MYPVTNEICLGVMGLRDLATDCHMWASLGANLVMTFSNQEMLPIHAVNHGLGYGWRISQSSEMKKILNPLLPKAEIDQPSMWWILPTTNEGKVQWPSGGPEPQLWFQNGKMLDVDLMKSCMSTTRVAPTFAYTPGHYPRVSLVTGEYVQPRMWESVDIQCAALYDETKRWPVSHSMWRCVESTSLIRPTFAVLNAIESDGATPKRVMRNMWTAMAMGCKGILIYNGASLSGGMAEMIGEQFQIIKSLERFFGYGSEISVSNLDGQPLPEYEYRDPKSGKLLFRITGYNSRLVSTLSFGVEALVIDIDFIKDTVATVRGSSWKRPK